ncbi:hypothetical protein P7C73_g3575, partial [Tremellales sp. Uapishka_1]
MSASLPATQPPPDPTTPIDTLTTTPNLSSPDTPRQPQTPHINLKTPMEPIRDASARSMAKIITDDEAEEEDAVGLGYGNVGHESVRVEVELPPREKSRESAEQEEDEEFPDGEKLRRMQQRVEQLETADGGKQELVVMLKSLLTPALQHLPFLHEQLGAQRATIATMQQQARLSEQLTQVERDRHAAERASWQTETRALINARETEAVAGTKRKKVLDLDVGYHQELEAVNKRLEMDNRLMAPRLADTQRQIENLVTELRHLRPHVILSSQPLSNSPYRASHPFSSRRKSVSPHKTSSSTTTMGDARAEHLLLAARKVRAMRAEDERVGRVTLDELQRGGVVGPDGGLGYAEGFGVQGDDDDDDDDDSEEDEKPTYGAVQQERRLSSSAKGKGKASTTTNATTPLLPRAKRSSKRALPPPNPTTPSRKSHPHPPQTTPGGSNFNDLLLAAGLASRPGTPSKQIHMSAMSATRSTTRPREETGDDESPVKKSRRTETWTTGGRKIKGMEVEEEEDHPEASALDLLAQASSLEERSTQLQFADMVDEGASPRSSAESALGPAISLKSSPVRPKIEDFQIDPSLLPPPPPPSQTPIARPRSGSITTPAAKFLPQVYPSPSLLDDPFDAGMNYQSPTGATVPGLGRYVHLTSNVPARRLRSPYLKWTVEEDELLARAVAIHGEKWDLVSKGVPTRSYHQVRQRWLRKTGAFDKKPSMGEDLHGMSSLNQGCEDEEETSPTPVMGRTASVGGGAKKR